MKNFSRAKLFSLAAATAILLATACTRAPEHRYQGYLEGDYLYVASPLAGRLDTLAVTKGARVAAGAPLFSLERDAELAAQSQAADQLRSAQARLEDLKKGSRPTELAALEARLDQARAAAELAKLDLDRQAELFKNHVISASDFDRARLTHERNTGAVDELAAQLATATLGARPDARAAAAGEVAAAAAAKERADWSVEQKAQAAPRAALVYDTLYRPGEFVAAGLPVVSLLPPENLKVRFFVPEAEFAALKAGAAVLVNLTGVAPPLAAKVSYLSPQPEYTPPVLYNRENRSKLVFLVEAVFTDPAVARDLHPGQPADVTLAKP
ncbi:MAG: HlyD family efflux transporter periplasmic adaptor subunit [Opitutae bacterium]|nr:HlyD family efflux transporter periplasmic adaptor subunit [Opitutae bacterium]